MRAVDDDGPHRLPSDGLPSDELGATVLGPEPSPLAVLEGTAGLLDMDRHEAGTPLGDLEQVNPR